MKNELRLTDTNAGSDSQGRTWGLEGNLFWYLVIGLGMAITCFFALTVLSRASLVMSVLVAVVPIVLAMAYVGGLRHGKPPGYDRDLLELMLAGKGFGPEPGHCPPSSHPLAPEEAAHA